MGFFESDIVQEEAKKLFTDYQELMKLGSDYGKFDREGKKMFIKKMETLMDRYKVFMKRFELSEDFQANMRVEQLKTQLSQFGITPDQKEVEKIELDKDVDLITPADLYRARGNVYSWMKNKYKKACSDWKVSKKLGDEDARANFRDWKC